MASQCQACESDRPPSPRESSSDLMQDVGRKHCRGNQPLRRSRWLGPEVLSVPGAGSPLGISSVASTDCAPEMGKHTKGVGPTLRRKPASQSLAPSSSTFPKTSSTSSKTLGPGLVTCHTGRGRQPLRPPRGLWLGRVTRVAQDAAAQSHFLSGDSTAH